MTTCCSIPHVLDATDLQVGNLRWLAKHTKLPLIQLLDPAEDICWDTKQTYGDMMTDAGLDAIAQYASGVGLDKQDLLKGEQPGAFDSSQQC